MLLLMTTSKPAAKPGARHKMLYAHLAMLTPIGFTRHEAILASTLLKVVIWEAYWVLLPSG
jgi:hypothetical protein